VNIAEEIRKYIVNTFLFGQGDDLSNDDSFLAQGIVDSTGILELVALIEETYSVTVYDDELVPENFDSINRVAGYVTRKLAAKEAAARVNEETLRS
jgi:acyl carrier protein